MEDDDIGADIAAAFAEVTGEPDPAPKSFAQDVDPANETPVELPSDDNEKPTDGRVRGPDGKFVAKIEEKAQVVTDQPSEAVADPADKLAIRAPASWSPDAKAKFATLDPAVQTAIAKREQEIDHGLRRKSEELKRYDGIESVVAPRRALWAAQGLDEASAIKTLLAAQDLLEQDPHKGLEFLAKSYGVNLNAPAQPQGQPQAQPQGNSQEIQQMRADFARLEQQLQAAQTAPVVSQVESFFSDPKNLYAENVRPDMAVLLREGRAKDLAEAYEMACWMRPDIRPLLQTPQIVTDPGKAQRARDAGSSINGAPSTVATAKASNGSAEDDVRFAIESLSARA